MIGIKVTPFILFLILLITLVISMLFANSWVLSNKYTEGFVSYGYSNSNIMNVTLSPYSTNQVIYLYDNLYFDGKNGNIVEVDSPYCGNVRVNGTTIGGNISCNDSTGSTIKNIWVTTSSSSTTKFTVPVVNNAQLNNIASLSNNPSISQITYLSNAQQLSIPTGYRYQLFYISWGADTYLHMIGLDPRAQLGENLKSYYYNNSGSMMRYIDFTPSTYIPNYKQSFNSNTNENNNKLILESGYHATIKIFQITNNVKYDLVNGQLLIGTAGNYKRYDRSTGTLNTTATLKGNIDNLNNFISWIVSDENNGMVVVMAFAKQTVVCIINADPNNNIYNLSYCLRFTENGIIMSLNDADNIFINNNLTPTLSDISNNQPCHDELSCKWYYYFKTIGKDPAVLFKNDFIRKTQIVPPVCPTCPNCAVGSGVCTSCGGNGGSGTSDSSGSLIRDAAKGTVNLAKDTVTGTVDLAKDAVGGTVDLAKDTVGGVVGLAKDTVGGAVDLVKDTAGGIRNGIRGDGSYSNSVQSDSGHGYVPGQGYTPVDRYSAYGALQSKGANFMPVTASFSAFGK